jgi:tRNA1Val (adenine37-N6)-methyltransferase
LFSCLDEFVEEPEDEYDLIVSNPHFIPKTTKQQDLARFQEAMPFEDLRPPLYYFLKTEYSL